jgi:hypothetical protein
MLDSVVRDIANVFVVCSLITVLFECLVLVLSIFAVHLLVTVACECMVRMPGFVSCSINNIHAAHTTTKSSVNNIHAEGEDTEDEDNNIHAEGEDTEEEDSDQEWKPPHPWQTLSGCCANRMSCHHLEHLCGCDPRVHDPNDMD